MSISKQVKDFKHRLFDEAKDQGFTDWEFYYSASQGLQVKIFESEISEYKISNLKGFSFRGTFDGKMAYFSSENFDPQTIPFVVKSAIQNAKIMQQPDQDELFRGDEFYPEIQTYFEPLENITIQEKIAAAKLMEKTALEADDRVVSVDNCAVMTGSSENYISNSLGLDLHKRSNYAIGYVSARVKENGQTKTAIEAYSGTDWTRFEPKEIAKIAVKKALASLGAKSVPSAISNVIFENSAASDFLETFSCVFYADNVQKGFSLLKGKLGEQIASAIFTLRDDNNLENSIGNTPFDSEGVATFNKAVIENGVLKTYLHNLKTAKKDGVKSTGNGFKNSIKSPVEISTNNMYVPASDSTVGDLIKRLDNGIIVTSLAGLHSGANAISGDFSLSASGYLIEHGEISRAVEQITVSGNFYELLKNVECIADDLYFGTGTIGSPSMLIKGINISGD